MLGLGMAGCEARIGGAAAQAFTVAGGDHLAPPESIYQAQGDNGWSEDGRRMIEEALPARGKEMSRWKLRKQIEELEKENRGLLATINQMRQEMQALADENRRSTAEIEKLQGRVEHQARNLAETRALAYEFGSTANSVSGADIRGMMQGLNSEIFQTAASLSCSLHFRSPPTKFTSVTPAPELFQRMTRILGPIIVDFILKDQSSKTGSSMLVQIALQAALTHWGCDTINSRLLGGDDTINSFIHELYRGIRHSGKCHSKAQNKVLKRHRKLRGCGKMEGDDSGTTHHQSNAQYQKNIARTNHRRSGLGELAYRRKFELEGTRGGVWAATRFNHSTSCWIEQGHWHKACFGRPRGWTYPARLHVSSTDYGKGVSRRRS
jgi:hypothetical protein